MIYETSLKHLKARRSSNKHGSKSITALEVNTSLKVFSWKAYTEVTFSLPFRVYKRNHFILRVFVYYGGSFQILVLFYGFHNILSFVFYRKNTKKQRTSCLFYAYGFLELLLWLLTTSPQVFLLGALAKLGATVSTYPLLVVKVQVGGTYTYVLYVLHNPH